MKTVRAPGKWIDGIDGTTPLDDAVRNVLDVRLAAVEQMLPLAREDQKTPEIIHQLRVATRRADAALVIFRDCLRRPRLEKTRRRLKRIRRAAGGAREADVYGGMLEDHLKDTRGADHRLLEALITWNKRNRKEAQKAVESIAIRYPVEKLARGREKLLRRVERPERFAPGATLRTMGNESLRGVLGDVREAAARDLQVIDHLHELRIMGKRLRYAMEVFAPCYAPAFRKEAYARVTNLQDYLGNINDCSGILERFDDFERDAGLDRKKAAALDHVRAMYQHDMDDRVEAFLGEWASGIWSDLFDSIEAMLDPEPSPSGDAPDVIVMRPGSTLEEAG